MATKVAVIGANGKVATLLTKRLAQLKSEFTTTAFIRNAAQASKFEEIGVNYSTAIDLTNSNLKSIAETLKGYDAVVFSAGAGGKGLDFTFSVDLDGAVKVAEAVKANGIKRFVLVSAIKSEDRDFWWDSGIRSYYIAKKYADEVISKLDINWTILQPGYLADKESTGKIHPPKEVNALAEQGIKDAQKNLFIPRDDVALVIIESLRNEKTIRKFIPLISGSVPVKDALNEL